MKLQSTGLTVLSSPSSGPLKDYAFGSVSMSCLVAGGERDDGPRSTDSVAGDSCTNVELFAERQPEGSSVWTLGRKLGHGVGRS
jgi:hypothetical protein